ncbi:hypothetical protein PG994_004102 [Apiospora phragmitis]|uniref:Uncharacterized protein n=1 Tax=Apiospora phragmitis TaxID=2905665 RepID=A0ABR1VTN8_9PEZI
MSASSSSVAFEDFARRAARNGIRLLRTKPTSPAPLLDAKEAPSGPTDEKNGDKDRKKKE